MSFGQFCNLCNILIRNMHVCMKPLFAPNIVLVSDEGGGLPGRQWSGLPSSQDAADYLLSGFTDCYRFTVGFNKHHQGVKTFGKKEVFKFSSVVCGQLSNYSIREERGSGDISGDNGAD